MVGSAVGTTYLLDLRHGDGPRVVVTLSILLALAGAGGCGGYGWLLLRMWMGDVDVDVDADEATDPTQSSYARPYAML